MSVVGAQTGSGAPVFSCPFCLTIKTRGTLKVPDTPAWRGEPGKDPRPRNPEDNW